MEPKFVCEFPLTEELMTNRIRKYNPGPCAALLVVGILAFVVIAWCEFMVLIVHGVDFSLYWGFMALFACASLLYGIFWPNIAAKRQIRRYRKELNTDLYRISFGDTIEIQQGSVRITWDYGNIRQVAHWKYTFELQKSRNLALMVTPGGFTKGTFSEFREFLREKRPDLTIPES